MHNKNNGLGLIELSAIVRMLNAMLDMADLEDLDELPVEGVRNLRDKYQSQIVVIERLSS